MSTLRTLSSIEAVAPHPNMSTKYKFVSTTALIDRLQALGWTIDQVKAPRGSKRGNQYSAHLISFRNASLPLFGDSEARIWLLNSHDGTRALSFAIGYFRLVCENGLIAPIKAFQLKARHVGNINQLVDTTIETFHAAMPQLIETRQQMINTIISDRDTANFAVNAGLVIQDVRGITPATVIDLVKARRPEDAGQTVWQVFNRIQEASCGPLDGFKTIEVKDTTTGLVSVQVVPTRVQALRQAGPYKELNERLFSLALEYVGGAS